jgi:hypothetical protein
MAHRSKESKIQVLQDLSAAQVAAIVQRSGISRDQLAKQLGCGTSQLFKYEKEGLPPRMDRHVRAAILQLGMDTEVLPSNAALRGAISKLSKDMVSSSRDQGEPAQNGDKRESLATVSKASPSLRN